MPRAEQHVDRRDQQDAVGDRAESRDRDEGIERVLAVFGGAAIAALAGPLGETEDEVEPQPFRPPGQGRVVVEPPIRRPRQQRCRPAAALHRQEEPEDERLADHARKRAIRELGRRCGRAIAKTVRHHQGSLSIRDP